MTRFTVLVCTLLLAGSVAGPTSAKSLARIVAGVGLTPDDFTMMTEAAKTLYETGVPKAGQTTTWANPDSGSRGTVRVVDVAGNCVNLQHIVRPKGETQSRELLSRRCRGADGTWVLQP